MRWQYAGPAGWLGAGAALLYLAVAFAGPSALSRDDLWQAAWRYRALPALAAAALVLLACDTTRRMGGTPAAQWLAGLCVLANPMFFSPVTPAPHVVFDQLCWTLGLWALLRRAVDDHPGWWLWMVAAIVAALGRRAVTDIALDARTVGRVIDHITAPRPRVTLEAFVRAQCLTGPAVLVAGAGLLRLLRDRAGSGTRVVGIAGVTLGTGLLWWQGESSAVAPLYPVLCGAGASQLSQWGESLWQRHSRWLVHGVSVVQFALGVLRFGR